MNVKEADRAVIAEITLPLPPRACHPNSRPHWAAKARAVKQARGEACFVLRMHPDRPLKPWLALLVQPVFYVARIGDGDNRNASLKSYADAFADAGWVDNDRNLTLLPAVQEVDRSNRRVVLEIMLP